jgi:ABC-type sulfate transport system permease component
MEHKLCEVSFGGAAAIVSIICVLLVALFSYLGYDTESAETMAKHHMAFFSMTPVGVITGALAAAVKGFVFGYLFAFFYNRCPFHSSK